jgi:hypothetical protein
MVPIALLALGLLAMYIAVRNAPDIVRYIKINRM